MKYLILDNVRSAYNVGAMFRTADAAGVEKVFLVGYTPAPTDRFGRIQNEIKKTSLGASESVAWEQVSDLPQLITRLQKDGVTVVAVEQAKESVSLSDFEVPDTVAYILGNEVEGINELVQKCCDVIIDIPMLGEKESLNVSVTAGIVLYHQLGK